MWDLHGAKARCACTRPWGEGICCMHTCPQCYLAGCIAHGHGVSHSVFQEAPSVLEARGRVLHHHQLSGVVDASEHSPPSVPVKLQGHSRREKALSAHQECSYQRTARENPTPTARSFPCKGICPLQLDLSGPETKLFLFYSCS